MAHIDVAGRTVLITGAAQGMGRLWAGHFAGDRARVALWDLNADALAQTAAELKSTGADVFTDVVDVRDRKKVYAAAERLERAFGPLDILVNNAGIVAAGPFLDVPDEKLAATIDVNLTSMFWTCKAFLKGMIERGRGHVVNVSSASGFIGVPYMPAYAASKWGVIGLTESLRLEMELAGHKGIGFTLFCPSYVDTGMFRGVKAPTLVPLLTPEEAVEKGYRAFCRGTYVIREPFMVKITPALRVLLPTGLFDTVSRVLGVTTSMKEWKGHGEK